MLAVKAIDIGIETERVDAKLYSPPKISQSRFAKALALTLLVPASIYILVFAAALSHGLNLRTLGLSKFGPILDYGYEAKHVDADVLIFGDSSAFLGIDPRVIDSELRLRTAVLPNTIGSLPMTGDLVLQRYFEHNHRPRLLVLYFSPWNLNYAGSPQKEFLLEGEEELLRYGSWRDIVHAVSEYPLQFLVFPFQVLEPLGLKHLKQAMRHEGAERGSQTARAFGHWDYLLPYEALVKDCQLRPEYTNVMLHNTVRMLRRRYEAKGMQVAIYLAPIPNCANALPVVTHSYVDVDAAPPALLPPTWFADDSFTAHVRPQYVRQTSILFAHRIRLLLAH